jgi:DNA mismatch repair protein MutH
VRSPDTEAELLARASALAGMSLFEAAAQAGQTVPPDLKGHKGWVGCLLEALLGATAGSTDQPDFEALGVELKTIPLRSDGQPLETTFVCSIDLLSVADVEWRDSRVYRKLRRVLWFPVHAERHIPIGERRLGAPFLWSPTPEQEASLRWDWEELAGMIGRGNIDEVTGHFGTSLQVRPKAAHSRVRRRGLDADGCSISVLPRGFYLRPSFTARIIRDVFAG